MARPKRVGFINIKVTARSLQAGDDIEQLLNVLPDGETQYENVAILADLRGKSEFVGNLTINIPKNVVPDSTKIEIRAVGMLTKFYIRYKSYKVQTRQTMSQF